VLAVLVAQAGQVVTKEALLDAVWPETVVTEGVLKGCIRQVRRVLGETRASTASRKPERRWWRQAGKVPRGPFGWRRSAFPQPLRDSYQVHRRHIDRLLQVRPSQADIATAPPIKPARSL
jgi:Transcriptional regulatory protein, C terminal